MARFLAIPYGHALSHVSRPLILAEELRRRGHEVVFAGGGPQLDHVRRKDFEVREIHEIDPAVLFGRIRARMLRFVEVDELERLVDADLAVFQSLKPDIVLTDGRIGGRLSTCIAGVRHAAIVNVSSTHHRAIPYVPLFEWVRPPWLREHLRRVNLWMEMAVFDRAVPAFRMVIRRHGLAPETTATNCLEGNDLTLLPDVPEFMPSRGLSLSHHYVGPLTFHSDLSDPPWWGEVQQLKKSGRRLVYFTLGTTGTRELFGHAAAWFSRHTDVLGVVSTGGQIELPDGGANLFLAEYLDGDRVMEMADLVVCHGGNGTIYQALRHGVPVVGIPTIPDQRYNTTLLKATGAGMGGALGDFGATLTKALDGLTGLQVAACRLRDVVGRRSDALGIGTASDLLEEAIHRPLS